MCFNFRSCHCLFGSTKPDLIGSFTFDIRDFVSLRSCSGFYSTNTRFVVLKETVVKIYC